jgi:hypothetical protein
VEKSRRIVIYDEEQGVMAARAYVAMDYMGLGKRASLLDGQFVKWRREGRPPSLAMMVAVMRLTAVLLCGFFGAVSALAGQDAPPAAVAEVRTVYVLPMAHGLDQFVASRLTRGRAVQIVADPSKADAILTDRLGASLEQKLDELYPSAPKPEPKADKEKADKDSKSGSTAEFASEAPPVPVSSFSRGKGTIFLVSTQSRAVLWSAFEKSSGTTPEALNKTADRIATRFERAVKPKPAH